MFPIRKTTCYELGISIKKGTLLIAAEGASDFDYTEGRIYVCTKDQGVGTFWDCLGVVNDKGVEEDISLEYFYLYEGEIIKD